MSARTSTVPIAEAGFSPLDEQLELGHNSLSPLLARDAVWLCGQLPYEQTAQVFQRIGGYSLPATTLWEQTQHTGRVWLAQQQQDYVSVERTRWETPDYQAHLRQSVSMDGGMVHVRGEGWKEFKVGVVGSLRPPWELSETCVARSQQLHYVAVLGGVAAFGKVLWQLAVQQQVPYAGLVVVTADGAAWIWRLATDLFPCSTQIVDWYHASQQVSALALTRFPTAPQDALKWAEQLKRQLWQGEGKQVIENLQSGGLSATYFEEHQRRMDYPAFRAQGYPVGSGTTESGVKQYKQRLCGAGMRWSRPGVERMVLLRSAVMDGSFDQHWTAA